MNFGFVSHGEFVLIHLVSLLLHANLEIKRNIDSLVLHVLTILEFTLLVSLVHLHLSSSIVSFPC
jgi:hypothetical protein